MAQEYWKVTINGTGKPEVNKNYDPYHKATGGRGSVDTSGIIHPRGGASSSSGGYSQPGAGQTVTMPVNTTRGALARIYQMNQTDPARAKEALSMLDQLRQNPTSQYYNPFARPTNRAVDALRDLGYNVDKIDDDWFNQNAYLKQYYVPTANTNSLSSTMTNKRASKEQKAAYYYNQLWMAEEATKKAESQWEALQKELSYKGVQADRNWSDEEIINSIDWKKYPDLAKMDDSRKQGTPVEMNRAIGYSLDAMYGVLWAARNGGGTGNAYNDMANSALGVGVQWQANAELAAKLDPTSSSYAPYTVGSTMDKERQYFGVSSFSKEWIEQNRWMLNSDNEDDRKNYISVLEADKDTDAAEQELEKLKSRLASKMRAGKDPEKVLNDLLETGDYPTLLKMDRSIQNGYVSKNQTTVNTTRKVDYDRNELIRYAQGLLDEKGNTESGLGYSDKMTGDSTDTTLPEITITQAEPGEVDAVTGADIQTPKIRASGSSKPAGAGIGASAQETINERAAAAATGYVDELGQFGRGNIDLWNRPKVYNPDGSVSTVASFSIGIDGKTVLLPSVVDGKLLDMDAAEKAWEKTITPEKPFGDNLGVFASEKEADEYAEKLHIQQEHLYGQPAGVPGQGPAGLNAAVGIAGTPVTMPGAQQAAPAVVNVEAQAAASQKVGASVALPEQTREVLRKWNATLADGYEIASDAGALTDTEDAVLSTTSAETESVLQTLNTTPSTTLASKSIANTARANVGVIASTKGAALKHEAASRELPRIQAQIEAIEGSIAASEDELDNLNMLRGSQPGWLIQDLAAFSSGNDREKTEAALDIYRTVSGNGSYQYNAQDTDILKKAYDWAEYLASDDPMIENAYTGDNRDGDLVTLREQETRLQQTIEDNAEAAAEYDAKNLWFESTMSAYEEAGIDTTELQVAKAVADYYVGLSIYSPTRHTGNSLYQDLEAAGKTRAEIEAEHQENLEKMQDAQFIQAYAEKNQLDLTEEDNANMQRQMRLLERDEKDWEYYNYQFRDDFQDMVEKGKALEQTTYDPSFVISSEVSGGTRTTRDTILRSGIDYAAYGGFISDKEKDTYYYLLGSRGAEEAYDFYEHLTDPNYGVVHDRNAQFLQQTAENLVDSGVGGAIAANALAVILSPAEAVSGAAYMIDHFISGEEYNQNGPQLMAGIFSKSVNEATMQSILESCGEKTGDGQYQPTTKSQIVSGLYEILYNRGRSAANAAVFNFLSFTGVDMVDEFLGATPMAIGAATMAISDAKGKGAKDGQALAIGTATFFAESLSEAITYSNIREVFDAKEVTAEGVKGALMNWLTRSGFEEATGEVITDFIENITDEQVMGELSDHASKVAAYKQEHKGASDEEAEEAVRRDELAGLLHTAIISYLSPGLDVAGTAVKYTGQQMSYYRETAREAQKQGYNVGVRDVRRMLSEKKNQPASVRVSNTPVRPAGQQTTGNQATEVAGEVAAKPAEAAQASETEGKAFVDNAATLESVRGTDAATQNAAIAKVLGAREGTTEGDLANAAATGLRTLFGGQEGAVDGVKTILAGAQAAGVNADQAAAAMRNAAVSPSSMARQVMESDEFKAAIPEQKATMLAATVEADSTNQTVLDEAVKSVMEHRVARKEADVIAGGALEGVRPAVEAAKDASRNARAAEAQLEEKHRDTEAAQEGLKTAEKILQNDPREGESAMREASKNVRNASTVEEEYGQKAENAKREEDKSKEKAKRDVDQAMAEVRQQATDAVAQEDQARTEEAALAQEKADREAEEKAVAAARQEADDNANEADFNDYMDRYHPDATEEERQHVRELWEESRPIMQQAAEQQAEQQAVEDIINRSKFLQSVGKKFNINIQEVDDIEYGANGAYDRDTNTLRLRKGATIGDALYAVLGHELTHITERSGDYETLANRLLGMFYGTGTTWKGILADMEAGRVDSPLARTIQHKADIYRKAGKNKDNDYYLQEVVADCMGQLLRADAQHPEAQQRLIEQLVSEDPSMARRILEGIKRFLKQLVGAKGAWQSEMQQTVSLFEKALKEAQAGQQSNGNRYSLENVDENNFLTDRQGNETDAQMFRGGTVALDTTRYSLNSFTPEEQRRTRAALLNAKDENGNPLYNPQQVDKYMWDATGIASMIAMDRTRLDFKASDNMTFLKKNQDYGFTLDASTLCAKRLLYQGTFNYVQHALPDEVFTPEDLVELVNIMSQYGYEVPCGICYVESRRRWLDTYANEFIGRITENPNAFVEKVFKKTPEAEKAALRERLAGEKPSIDDLTTTDGLEKLRQDDPYMYKAFVAAMNVKGSANPKIVQPRAEYKGEIRGLTKKQIQNLKDIGGLRIQSFSDFETPHLLDMIQAVYDMSAVGLTSQAYTKVPNFAWVFGGTGIKINLSLIGKGTGLDENGNLVFDNKEGIDFDEAMRLRERYSKNVGTIIVGINDDHIIAAMGDPRIDFIIPFHKSGWSDLERKGIKTLQYYEDYTDTQNERKLYKDENGKYVRENDGSYKTVPAKESKLVNFEPVGAHQYWEFDKSGEWNARKYLKMCAEDGRIPKFNQFLVDNGDGSFSLPEGDDKRSKSIREGYWKTLIDFKMYDNDGNGAAQQTVTPNINMNQAQRVLNEYTLKRPSGNPDAKMVDMKDNNDVPRATTAGDAFINYIKEKRAGRPKPTPPNKPLEATPEIDVMQQGGSRMYDANDTAMPMGANAAMASGAATELGNTPSIAQDVPEQNQQRMAIDAETGETTRYSLPAVNPVQSSDESVWQPGHTEAWFRENGFPIYQDVPLDQQEINRDTSKKGHGTQIASTESTYRKLFDRMKKENPDNWQNMRVLDASSGLGLGTQAGREQGFNVTDIEPFPNSQYTPDYTDYTELLRQVESGEIEPFDYIVSNAVLNVIPQDTRDNLVDAMGKLLAPGGKLFVNVISKDYAGAAQSNPDLEGSKAARKGSARTMEGDYTQRGNAAGRGHETFVWGSNSVQKVFSTPELIGYLKDALGDGYTVKRDSIGMTGVLVTKDSDFQETTRYSLPSDAPYIAAVERGEMDRAQEMVDEAAKEAGYTTPKLYHGTRDFGFTEFDLDMGEQLIFATTDRRIGETYSGETSRSKIQERTDLDVDNLHGEELLNAAKENLNKYEDYRVATPEDRARIAESSRNDVQDAINHISEYLEENPDQFDADKREIVNRIVSALDGMNRATSEDEVSNRWSDYESAIYDLMWMDESVMREMIDDYLHKSLYFDQRKLSESMYSGDIFIKGDPDNYEYTFDNQLAIELGAKLHQGVYELYGKPGNQLVIDAQGGNWNNIQPPEELGLYGPQKTRDIAAAAMEHGYDSVLLKNLRDSGGETPYNAPSDIYIFFNPNAVKSADTVTYDDAGNIIPLSERFNQNNDDIRYQLPDDMVLRQQIREYLAGGGSLSQNTEPPRADRPTKQRQWGSARAERSPMLHDQTIQYLKENSEYDPDTNQEQINRSFRWIQSHANNTDSTGYYGAVAEVESPDFDYRSADGQARMLVLMGMAATQGDVATELRLADAYNRQGTDLGQQLQARKIFQLMTPLGRQAALQKEAGKINDRYKRQGKQTRVTLSPETLEEAGKAKTPEEFDKVRKKAAKELAAQMPANWKDKLMAWRMLSMLGNPRTHVRNILGNLLFMPAVSIKNKVGAVTELSRQGVENVAAKIGRREAKQFERAKTLGLANKDARAFAKADAKAMEAILRGDAKYKEGNQVEQERKIFGQGKGPISKTLGKALQGLSDFNSNRLEDEDWIFLSRHYRNALAGYMTANKLKASDMTGEKLDAARAYAVQEAQKATYRDANAVADWLNEANRKHPGIGFVVNAVLPFKKTPANILKRGVEYSPVGLVNALTRGAKQVKMWSDYQNGKLDTLPDKAISPTQFIDKISAGLTGTGIMLLGAMLSGLGAATAGLDDDDAFEKLQGEQEYAINPGKVGNALLGLVGAPKLFGEDVSYTIDWAAPSCMPFFVGAAIMDTYKNRDNISIESVLNDLAGITEPVFNLSMLDGVNSLLDVNQYAEGTPITQIGEKILTNYVTSYVPSALGAVTRTKDTTRRKAYVESGADLSTFKYAWEGVENKLPWLSTTNIPYRNIWGEAEVSSTAEALIENFVSPGYANTLKNDPVTTELKRIYEAEGLTDEERKALVPKAAGKTIGSMKLNAEQYDQYVVSRGQTAHDTLEALMESPLWQISDDPTRARMVNDAWTYANQISQHEITGRKLDGWVLESSRKGSAVQAIASRAADANRTNYIAAYGRSLAEALDGENDEDYDTSMAALENAEATPTEIRKGLRDYFKPLYQQAYEKNDDDRMEDIRYMLIETGTGFKSSDFKSWVPGEEDEDEELNTDWLNNN